MQPSYGIGVFGGRLHVLPPFSCPMRFCVFPPEQPTAAFPYQLESLIGQGAMGKVYRAQEPALGRKVAIKVLDQDLLARLPPEETQLVVSRFMQEAKAAAALSHPGITTIHSVGVCHDQPYIVMEWLKGQTLEEALEERGTFEPARAIKVIVGVLEALEKAHAAGIVHRDIKPANLFLLEDDERVKIMDFGIAHVEQSDLVKTQAHAILGTPLYAAPEQLMGVGSERRSDLYATGVVLYEMLTGTLPFDGRNVVELLHHIQTTTPAALRSFNPEIHLGLEEVVMRALEADPERRAPHCRGMIEMLLPYLERPSTQEAMDIQVTEPTLPPEHRPKQGPRALRLDHTLADTRGAGLLVKVFESWATPEPFGEQSTHELLARVLERPLHARAFAGAVRFGGTHYVLVADGLVYAAADLSQGTTGDLAYESLPARASASLLPVPHGWDQAIVLLLASLIHPSKLRHKDVVGGLVRLVERLAQEQFSGVIKLRRKAALATLLFWGGQHVMSVVNAAWQGQDVSWQSLCDAQGVVAEIEDCRTILPAFAYRHELRGFLFEVDDALDPDPAHQSVKMEHALSLRPMGFRDEEGRALRGSGATRNLYRSDPVFSCLCWMLTGMPEFFMQRDLAKQWKYLSGWTRLIRRVRLHDELERPAARQNDFFDLITQDATGKVLHLLDHVHRVGPQVLEAFVHKVTQAKEARTKTGDVGGAILVGREFDPAVFEAYKEHVSDPEQKSLLYTLQNSFNKYEGFVRMGPTRGFHLLLVRESEHGFEPLLLE